MRPLFCLLLFFAAVNTASAEYIVFYDNGKAGLRDEAGKVILPAAFDALGWTDGSFSIINQVTGFRQQGKWGLINLKKEFVTKAEYETVTSAGGDRVIASRKINPYTTKYGCLDLTGKITVPFLYDGIKIHGLRAIVFVKNGAKYEHGLIDLYDKSILPVKYRDIRPIGSLRFAIQDFNQRTALFSENGVQLTEFVIDSISAFRKGNAIIYQNFKQGLIDREGTIQVQPEWRELRMSDRGIEGRAGDTWKILDANNKEIKSVTADELTVDGGHYLLALAGKHGVVDEDLNRQIDLKYDYLKAFDNNLSVARKGNKYGVVSIDGREKIPFDFDSLAMEGNFVRAMNKGQWVVYDTIGIKKTDHYYESLLPFNGKFFAAQKANFWGAVDRFGKEVFACVYDSILSYDYENVVVKFKGLYGVIDYNQHWKVLPQKSLLSLVQGDYYLEKQDSTLFLKKFPSEIIYFTTNDLKFVNGVFEERSPDGTIKQVTLNGISSTIAAPARVDRTEEVFEESEGMRGIRRDGRYGFVDSRGRLRIANRYEGIGTFKEGLAPIMILGKWGFVDKQDNVAINPNFEQVSGFTNGIAIVRRAGKTGVINRQGQFLLPMRYDSIRRVESSLIIFQQDQSGVADTKGRVLIEPRFDHLELLPNNLVIVRDRERWGVLTMDGMPVVPLIYSYIKYNPTTNQFLANQKSDWKLLK